MQKQSCRNSSPPLLNWPMASPAIFDHEKLDVYRVRENAPAQQFEDEDDDEHEDERRPN